MSYHTIRRLGSYSITLPDDNTPNYNNESLLFTFARPLITNTANFSLLRSRASSSDYTESLWDGDVKLVVYISGLYTGCEYKVRCQRNGCGSINRGGGGGGDGPSSICPSFNNDPFLQISVDNQSYWVLLYFFSSFVGCFAILLTIFIVGWYVRRRIAIRAYMRVSVCDSHVQC